MCLLVQMAFYIFIYFYDKAKKKKKKLKTGLSTAQQAATEFIRKENVFEAPAGLANKNSKNLQCLFFVCVKIRSII